jgi:hypothetical protein
VSSRLASADYTAAPTEAQIIAAMDADPPAVNVTTVMGTALTQGAAGRLAAAYSTFGDVATPVATAASVNQTGDSFARLGAPAGASVSADIATVDGIVDDILEDTGATIPATLAGLATSGEIAALEAHGDTTWATADVSGLALETTAQAILLDTGTTIPATLAALPADIDTQLSITHGAGAWGEGTGVFTQIYTVYQPDGVTPDPGVAVRMTTDAAGLNSIDHQITNAAGQVALHHNLVSGTTVYLWRYKADRSYDNPDVEVIP